MDLQEDVLRMSGTDPWKCMYCGKCSATCPSSVEMDVRPHRFVKSVIDGNIQALMETKTLKICLTCFACVERCPRAVEPASLIEAVRLLTIRKQDNNYIKPDDIPGVIELDEDVPQQLIVSALRKYSK